MSMLVEDYSLSLQCQNSWKQGLLNFNQAQQKICRNRKACHSC
uniref:Uncharacterized protein n=1 Tax=Rhizophora mucronata TaxID=61149 RepID=A0A2P2JY66_RHIMU